MISRSSFTSSIRALIILPRILYSYVLDIFNHMFYIHMFQIKRVVPSLGKKRAYGNVVSQEDLQALVLQINATKVQYQSPSTNSMTKKKHCYEFTLSTHIKKCIVETCSKTLTIVKIMYILVDTQCIGKAYHPSLR